MCKVSTEDVETFSAMVKLAQEESASESEYCCDFHVKRVLTGNGGDVERETQWLSTKREG